MLAILSPAKSLDFDSDMTTKKLSQPEFVAESTELIGNLRRFEPAQLASLMHISDNLADLNHERYAQWEPEFDRSTARPAALAFKGDVYLGLEAYGFSEEDVAFAQDHLRILSGLYGVLRPLDLMLPYRLEMGRKIDTVRGKNLYEFWGNTITEGLNNQFQGKENKYLINLASNEYFKVIKPELLQAEIITPHFKDYKNGDYKVLGVYAKKARGMLSRYIIKHRIEEPEAIKQFSEDGYRFDAAMSSEYDWVFTRKK